MAREINTATYWLSTPMHETNMFPIKSERDDCWSHFGSENSPAASRFLNKWNVWHRSICFWQRCLIHILKGKLKFYKVWKKDHWNNFCLEWRRPRHPSIPILCRLSFCKSCLTNEQGTHKVGTQLEKAEVAAASCNAVPHCKVLERALEEALQSALQNQIFLHVWQD